MQTVKKNTMRLFLLALPNIYYEVKDMNFFDLSRKRGAKGKAFVVFELQAKEKAIKGPKETK